MKNPSAEIDQRIQDCERDAVDYIVYLARKILRKSPNLHEFVMAMGVAMFTDHYRDYSLDEKPEWSELNDFINEWDNQLKLTGIPMCFTAEGEIVREW
jgi:hypothetical protein